MRRFSDRFLSYRHLPPDLAAEHSRSTPTHSDALAAAIEMLIIAENTVDIPALKQGISIIRTVLQSVEVKVIDYLCLGWRFLTAIWFFLRNQTIIKRR